MSAQRAEDLRARFARVRERWSDPLLTVLTILLALMMFVVAPLQAANVAGAHAFGFIFALALAGGVLIVSASTVAVASTLTAIALVATATVLRARNPSILDVYMEATAWILIATTLGAVVAHAVFAAGRITYHRIIGAVLLYLTIGAAFTALFAFVSLLVPNAFSGLPPPRDDLAVGANLIYFSFVTLTSVGYGDILPVHPVARSLANIEAIIGQLYPATLLARMVTLELEQRRGG